MKRVDTNTYNLYVQFTPLPVFHIRDEAYTDESTTMRVLIYNVKSMYAVIKCKCDLYSGQNDFNDISDTIKIIGSYSSRREAKKHAIKYTKKHAKDDGCVFTYVLPW